MVRLLLLEGQDSKLREELAEAETEILTSAQYLFLWVRRRQLNA